MKMFLTLHLGPASDVAGFAVEKEHINNHESEAAMRAFVDKTLETGVTEVRMYRLLNRAYSERVTKFDTGNDVELDLKKPFPERALKV